MTYDLAIGDRGYSSWSLRGWLLFDAFGIPVRSHTARLYTDELPQLLAKFAPARTVPVMRTPEGQVVPESLAIAEELASRHPDAGIWPPGPARAVARVLAAEMHAGFSALRSHCPMNLRVSYQGCNPPPEVLADLARLEHIWAWARAETGATGDWLCGPYSAADAFFAPVAARITAYNLPVGPAAQAYVAAHLAHPSFRRWRAMGLVDGADQEFYRRDYPQRPWPGPVPLAARAVDAGPSENTACPYSGKPVSDFMALDGRIFGFCNPFCRDKTVADPEAWPKFMAIYTS
ncbi:glutathione S-transferase [Fertoebacter nigrum]|uniref:Glutathione S-transferase n=1 Tax=Fertoeibacter niger TaxID=2656921 RepID=A0A8X8KPG5_9RHOB|nr:glutathione S-transferase [Fertoeibacter niger]NUB45090.1 glutathione S-transferase [Fertoeibacter niger]